MILSNVDIRRFVRQGKILIAPYDEQYVQPCSYDVHLHPDILYIPIINRDNEFDPEKDNSELFSKLTIETKGYLLWPNQCILGRTVEEFAFSDDLAGRLEGVSTLGRIFLSIHSTAGFFDASFRGTATLEIKNISPLPIRLRPHMRIGQMAYSKLSIPANPTYASKGRYQGQIDATPSRPAITAVHDGYDSSGTQSPGIITPMVQPLRPESA